MKAQVTSILLCALLCSTLGHEYLSARKFASETKSNYRSRLAHFQERSANQEQCELVCQGGSNKTDGLSIIVNETTSLIGVVNITANVALIIDINASLVGLFNGSSGAIIIINIKTGSGVYIAAGQTTKGWISSKISFELFFKSLVSLQVFIDLKIGTTFNISSASSEILEIVGNLLGKLSYKIQLELIGNVKVAITILVKISTSIIVRFQGSLKILLKLWGSGLISLYGDIRWLLAVLEGLELFFEKIEGGLERLIKIGVEFNWALILRATNGGEVLVNLLLAIVARESLSSASKLFQSEEELLKIIVKLGGDSSTGVNGVFKIAYEIIGVINGRIKIEVLIQTLLEFGVDADGSGTDISSVILGLKKLIEIEESRPSSEGIKYLKKLVKNLEEGSLQVGKVNISEIINILVKGVEGGVINLVVTILLRLTVIVKAVESIPSLLLYLLRSLNTTEGANLVQRAVPGLSIRISGSFNIYVEIFQGVNIATLLKLITSGFDISTVLTNVSVCGPIYKSVEKSVSEVSKGSLTLKEIIKSSESASIVSEIRAWFQESLKIFQSGGGGVDGTVTVTGGQSWTLQPVTWTLQPVTWTSKPISQTVKWSWGQGRSGHGNHHDQKERHHKQHHD